jgi:hypothetical protein
LAIGGLGATGRQLFIHSSTTTQERPMTRRRADIRRHPIAVVLQHASYGETPRDRDLDALELSPATRRQLVKSATEVVAVRLSGQNQAAEDMARDRYEQLIAGLPSRQRDPDYLKPADPVETNDPAELAKGVPKW